MGDSSRSTRQKSLTAFFQSGGVDSEKRSNGSTKRRGRGSHFGSCPICDQRFPYHRLELHASNCTGPETNNLPNERSPPLQRLNHDFDSPYSPPRKSAKSDTELKHTRRTELTPTSEPIPGLFLYEDFITEEQEQEILSQLDGTDPNFANEFLNWKPATFNGTHLGKRWGVHCDLRSRRVGAAENPLPNFVKDILIPKLRQMGTMKGCVPNEANAIDYYQKLGHHLVAHVDDRKLSKEPIANISLAGDCYMTFTNVSPTRNTAVPVQRVLLKRRCLQILTGTARYDFAHGITTTDLLSERRVSVTMRESPLTLKSSTDGQSNAMLRLVSQPSTRRMIAPSLEPIPGLLLFPNFISEAEEVVILNELDALDSAVRWSTESHTGLHREKRWGIDHDLWSRELRKPKHALPNFMHNILIPRFKELYCMKGCVPNEVNAIDYRKLLGHSLVAHVDDRQKHKEPIANLSLAGDCYMEYRNVKNKNCHAVTVQKVLLQRRTLQVLTGQARFDYSHGIANTDLLSDRRVSVTMREMRR